MAKCMDKYIMCNETLQHFVDWTFGAPDEILQKIYMSKIICVLGRFFNVFQIGSKFEGHMRGEMIDTDIMLCFPNIPSNSATELPFQMIATEKPGYVNIRFNPEFARQDLVPFTFFEAKKSEIEYICKKIGDTYILPNETFKTWMKSAIMRCGGRFFDNTWQSENIQTDTSGPALNVKFNSIKHDCTIGIFFNKWPEQAREWQTRPRKYGWPDDYSIASAVRDGVSVVPVGHKLFQQETNWRLSFSHIEQRFIWNFSNTQRRCYMFLGELKNRLQVLVGDIISSYHIKTLMFWSIEETLASVWSEENLLVCVLNCINRLKMWIENKRCPNYFIPDNDMFEAKFMGGDDKRYKILNYLRKLIQPSQNLLTIVNPDIYDTVRDIPPEFFESTGKRLCRKSRSSYKKEGDALKPIFMALAMWQKLCVLQEFNELKMNFKWTHIINMFLSFNHQTFIWPLKQCILKLNIVIVILATIARACGKILMSVAPQYADLTFASLNFPLIAIIDVLDSVPQSELRRFAGSFKGVLFSVYGYSLLTTSLPSQYNEIQLYLKQGDNMDMASGTLRLAAFHYMVGEYDTALQCTYDVIRGFQKNVVYVSQHPPNFRMQKDAEPKNGWFVLALDVSFSKSKHVFIDPKGINILKLFNSSSDVVDFPPMIFAHLLEFFCHCCLGSVRKMDQALSQLVRTQGDEYHTRYECNMCSDIYKHTANTVVMHCNKLYGEYSK